MPHVHTLVIGAGQAGLAMSRCLTDAGVDHRVLERGRTAERWHGRPWEALRLLTPNWSTQLPAWHYRGADPDGYMTATELASELTAYAASFDAPIEHGNEVCSLTRDDDNFVVRTGSTTWRADNVVVATGWCDRAHVPALSAALSGDVGQLTPDTYRAPGQLPPGGVLVVGAAASGVQLADELVRSGREVLLAAGRHSRLPRRYRGMDIWWWLDRIGTFATTIDEVADPERARLEGAVQLIGRDDHRNVDLAALDAVGVELHGRLTAVDGTRVRFAGDLPANAAADARLNRLLDRIDEYATRVGLDTEVPPPERPRATPPGSRRRRVDLRQRGIATVVWATGYRRSTPWLRLPAFDRSGEICQRRGITPVEGLYVIGQRFQHRRDSNFIGGVRHDAAFLTSQIAPRRHQPQLAAH